MSKMYCPNCQQNVLTRRENFSFLLAFLLAFTGIGLVIYILYYVDKRPDRCLHCYTKCEVKKKLEDKTSKTIPKEQLPAPREEQQNMLPSLEENLEATFCPSCGVSINGREGIFCAYCGNVIE
ncbi:MAG: hypothetical protein GF383_09330 [Candidatus Lokiarchaeota archaeon]|nr:hypothetical protein [Candidatus Lokiarchaeota archaeon]MBD3340715.1 hypothetical protein [Candidatus Lokiarchaeota archaeon]